MPANCPSCAKTVHVRPEGLSSRARCQCEALRAKALAQAGETGNESGAAAGAIPGEGTSPSLRRGKGAREEKEKVPFHPDSRHIEKCLHCGIVFCAVCDVRDKKKLFRLVLENVLENIPGGKGGRWSPAVGPTVMESGKRKKVRNHGPKNGIRRGTEGALVSSCTFA